jgi:hypothetical protein
MKLNWPLAAVTVALLASVTTCSISDQRHRNDDSVACSKSGGQWHETLLSRDCRRNR